MRLPRPAKELAKQIVGHWGYKLVPRAILYDWQLRGPTPVRVKAPLPAGADQYLRSDNPRLTELRTAYRRLNSNAMNRSVWVDDHVKDEDLTHFRGDSPYVWQTFNCGEINYALTTYYVTHIDKLDLLTRCDEDTLFGAYTFFMDGKIVSRDLLDSIVEINFLERHLQLSCRDPFTVVDIGAGYGRLAHRMVPALPNLRRYLCTDAIAVSTFLCEYYVQFRGLRDKVFVTPLHDLVSSKEHIDIAINMHSFSECSVSAVDWWCEWLAGQRVRYLMVVPNAYNEDHDLLTAEGDDFRGVIEKHGYRLIAKEPKYTEPCVQKYGVFPTHHYLFRLDASSTI